MLSRKGENVLLESIKSEVEPTGGVRGLEWLKAAVLEPAREEPGLPITKLPKVGCFG